MTRLVRAVLVLAPILTLACSTSWLRRFETPAWEEPPPPIEEGPVVPADRLHRAVLENGLEILVLEDHTLPRLGIGMLVRRGADLEARDRAGLASFTAEMMKRGAGEWDAFALARAVDDLGGSLSVGADWDSVQVGISGLSEDQDRLFEILVAVVRSPRFEPEEAERARSQRLAALERAKDDPSTLAAWHLQRVLYPHHRYGLPLEGNPEAVSLLDAAEARAFHERIFLPGNAILYFVGDVAPEEALALARKGFGDWAPGEIPPEGPAPPARSPAAPRVVIVNRPDLEQAQIRIGHEGIARTDPDRVALGLANTVFGGGGFLSRLMNRIRSDEGLTYSVGSGFSLRRHPGPFAIGTFTRVPETRRVVDLLLAEMERMRSEPPSQDELRTAKSLSAGRFALGLETSAAIAGALVDLDTYGLPRDSLDTYRSRLQHVTSEQVARLMREHLHPERAAIVVVGPAEALGPLLEPLGPIEVVQP